MSTISVHLIMNITPQLHKKENFLLYAMTMDYLPIQASLVLCRRVFSSSSETNTKKCNCINGLLMEALQMLKFSLKRDCLSINKCFLNTMEKDMNYNDLMLVYMPDTLPTDILTELMDIIGRSEMQNILDRAIAPTERRAAVDTLPTEEVVTEE